MRRNELTERLLGREIAVRFVSMAEARRLAAEGATLVDAAALEQALQAPMLAALEQEPCDLIGLAAVLADAIVTAQAFDHANEQAALGGVSQFLALNGIEPTPETLLAVHDRRGVA
jgi:prophage maintenance system killer protein